MGQKLLQLTGDRDAYKPRYSPDGRRILFGCATQNHENFVAWGTSPFV